MARSEIEAIPVATAWESAPPVLTAWMVCGWGRTVTGVDVSEIVDTREAILARAEPDGGAVIPLRVRW